MAGAGIYAGDFKNGRYSQDEIDRIMDVNARPTYLMKPFKAFYKKTASEHAPTWRDRREVKWQT